MTCILRVALCKSLFLEKGWSDILSGVFAVPKHLCHKQQDIVTSSNILKERGLKHPCAVIALHSVRTRNDA